MINYKEKIAQLLSTAVEGLTVEELQNMIEVPADSKMGDYAFPCFKLAKVLRKAPPMIAKGIADQIAENDCRFCRQGIGKSSAAFYNSIVVT